jgi:putative inorganic carbon (hco3(-)) transporter
MERLTFQGTGGTTRAEVPEVRLQHQPVSEAEIHPIVADPLPGESSDWAFGGLLAFTALLFFRPQDQIPALTSLHLAEASAVVGLSAMAAKRLARGLAATRVTHELVGLVLFGAVLAATSLSSFWPGGSIDVLTGMYLKVLLIVVLMANSITSVARLERFTWLVVIASGYLSARAVFDYVRGVNLVENGRVAGAVSGIFGNPNDLALNMVAFLPFAIFFAMRRSPRRADVPPSDSTAAPHQRRLPWRRRAGARGASGLWNWLAAGCAASMLLATVFTKSRSGFLGMVVMLVPVVWTGRRLRPGLGMLLVVILVASVPVLPASFWQRMGSIVNPAEDLTGSREARREVMSEALQVFFERPLTGIGPGQFKNYNPPGKQERWREAHDVWLQVASETGIAGVLAFAFLVVAAFEAATTTRKLLRRRLESAAGPREVPGRRRRSGTAPPPVVVQSAAPDLATLHVHATALVAALWGWMVCAIFASVAYNWTFYYLLGLSIATRDLAQARLAGHAERPAPAERRRAVPVLARS